MQQKTLIALGALVAIGLLAFITLRAPEKGERTGPRPQVFRQTATVRTAAPRLAAPRPAPAVQPTSAQALRALANQPSAKRLPMMALNSST